jgi:hypothetical protein
MATYVELLQAAEDDTLNKKARVAVIIAADVVRAEAGATANHATRLAWASQALRDPIGEGKRALWCALAQNAGLTSAQLLAASDAALQTAINAAVDLLAT